MSIVLGADNAGFELKELLKKVIKEEGFEVVDLSETPAEDFVDAALAVSEAASAPLATAGTAARARQKAERPSRRCQQPVGVEVLSVCLSMPPA